MKYLPLRNAIKFHLDPKLEYIYFVNFNILFKDMALE